MVVRIRFGRGPRIARRSGKNARLARLIASFLTIFSVMFASFGIWRIATDLGWAGDFVFEGLLSHWQVWIALACTFQYSAWRLGRYALASPVVHPQAASAAEPRKAERLNATARV